MTIDEKIAVLQAHKEGKVIESKLKNSSLYIETWVPSWNFGEFDYRVKPEPEPPKYEPFTFEDDLLGKVVFVNETKKGLITSQDEKKVFISGFSWVDYDYLLSRTKKEDGAPCGKLIE